MARNELGMFRIESNLNLIENDGWYHLENGSGESVSGSYNSIGVLVDAVKENATAVITFAGWRESVSVSFGNPFAVGRALADEAVK